MDWFKSPNFGLRAKQLMRIHKVPGFSIAILQGDEVASRGFGHAVLDPPTACTPDTLFDIASSSKSYTGVCVGLLAEDDEKYPEVKWDAPLSKLLPEDFAMPDEEYTRSVTLDDIISHRTGMPRHDLSCMGPNAERPDDARSVTRSLRHLPLTAPIRTKHLYNNLMFTVASHLVEEKTQGTFSDFLEERIFVPLGMESTSLQPSRAVAKGFAERIAMGYCWDKEKKTYLATPSPECPEGQGAGSIITSANDFIKWVKGLVHREGPISENVYRELVRQRSLVNPSYRSLRPYTSPASYGAGVEVYYYRGHAVVTHSGAIDGFGSQFTFLPALKFGVVVCGNSGGAGSVSGVLTRELMDEFIGIPKEERSYRIAGREPRAERKGKLPSTKGEEIEKKDDMHGSTDESDSEDEDENQRVGDKAEGGGQGIRLEAYAGRFRHAGYHTMVVQIKEDQQQLFIDATDRSFPFTLEVEHRSGGTEFKACLRDGMGLSSESVDAKFELGEDGSAVRMGLGLEPELKDVIWFDRLSEKELLRTP